MINRNQSGALTTNPKHSVSTYAQLPPIKQILATSDKNNDWLSTANDKLVPVGVFGQQDWRFGALITYHLTAPQQYQSARDLEMKPNLNLS